MEIGKRGQYEFDLLPCIMLVYSLICCISSLYNAIIKRTHELDEKSPTMKELRSQTAEFLRKNQDEFLPYLSHPDTGNMLTESQYAEYCDQVADKAWGGQIEVRSHIFVL